MKIVGFLTDIVSHLNDLNEKLQGKRHTIFNLFTNQAALKTSSTRLEFRTC